MVAGHDDAAVAGEASQNGKRGRAIETIIRIEFRYVFVGLGIGRHFQIAVDSEHLSDRHFHIRHTGFSRRISCESHCSSVTSARERKTIPGANRVVAAAGCAARFSRKFRGGESHLKISKNRLISSSYTLE